MKYRATFWNCTTLLLVSGTLVFASGCGQERGVVADQDELSRYVQEHPELEDAAAEESKGSTPEAAPARQAVKPSDS